MKKAEKKYAVSIKKMRINERSTRIVWNYANHPEEIISMLYRHSDNTWHFDRNTQRYGKEILDQLMSKYSDKCADRTYERLSRIRGEEIYTGIPSVLQRIENQIYKEEQYREYLKWRLKYEAALA